MPQKNYSSNGAKREWFTSTCHWQSGAVSGKEDGKMGLLTACDITWHQRHQQWHQSTCHYHQYIQHVTSRDTSSDTRAPVITISTYSMWHHVTPAVTSEHLSLPSVHTARDTSDTSSDTRAPVITISTYSMWHQQWHQSTCHYHQYVHSTHSALTSTTHPPPPPPPGKNWKTLLEQSFTASMSLDTATGACTLGRRHLSSPQRCHHLSTSLFTTYNAKQHAVPANSSSLWLTNSLLELSAHQSFSQQTSQGLQRCLSRVILGLQHRLELTVYQNWNY